MKTFILLLPFIVFNMAAGQDYFDVLNIPITLQL
jgi:hypothetical protein